MVNWIEKSLLVEALEEDPYVERQADLLILIQEQHSSAELQREDAHFFLLLVVQEARSLFQLDEFPRETVEVSHGVDSLDEREEVVPRRGVHYNFGGICFLYWSYNFINEFLEIGIFAVFSLCGF